MTVVDFSGKAILDLIEDRPDTPEGIELYRLIPGVGLIMELPVLPDEDVFWSHTDPHARPSIRTIRVRPTHSERHGGRAFRFGWSEEARVVVIWWI